MAVEFIPAAIGIAAITLKAILDPLSGFDASFRWDFLARQILRTGGLDFYPPVSSSDFETYAWCDGIAPLVSSQYLWTYLVLGATNSIATSPLVLAQAGLLFQAVYTLSRDVAGPAAGRFATMLLSSSAVFLWSTAMGQETGMTALALIAMLNFILRYGKDRDEGWLIWAGLAGAGGALAREYGLIYIALGALVLWRFRPPYLAWIKILLVFSIAAAPWYARNWFITGNPLYSHHVFGLFPTNPTQELYMQAVEHSSSFGALGSSSELPTGILRNLGLPLLVAIFSFHRFWKSWWAIYSAIIVMGSIWAWSVSQTAGGWFYSLRVLSPVIALCSVMGGAWLMVRFSQRSRWLTLGFALLAIDAGIRSLYLPVGDKVSWWREPLWEWRSFSQLAAHWAAQPAWTQLGALANSEGVLTSDPVAHSVLVGKNIRAVSLFSPAVHDLFDPNANFARCITMLRAQKIRFILMTQNNPINETFFRGFPFWRELRQAAPNAELRPYFVFDVQRLGADGDAHR